MKKKDFQKDSILRKAKFISKRKLCDNCLGRQFAQVSTNTTNRIRGNTIRNILGKKEPSECELCQNLFKRLDHYALKAIEKSNNIEYKTFAVGTKLSSDLVHREESLWEDIGIEYCEPLKSEINRELGKLIENKAKKLANEKKPEIFFLLDLEKKDIVVTINPLFVKGGYKKLVRGIPQTKWDKYKITVEDIIAEPFMKMTKGKGHSLHGMGREDIDALCLDWRPFVLEVKDPQKRTIDLKKAQISINKGKKINVSRLEHSDRNEIIRIKKARPDKTYRVLVSFERPIKDMESLKKLIGYINQETPKRVVHRRANLIRKRKVISIKWVTIDKKRTEFVIRGEAGIYIKELVTGDDGRTKPSISEILNTKAKVEELDVIKIHI